MSRSVQLICEELAQLQRELVSVLQAEHFTDDLEPPPAAFGWTTERLVEFFESGGQSAAPPDDARTDDSQPGGGRIQLRAALTSVPLLPAAKGVLLETLVADQTLGLQMYQDEGLRCGILGKANGLFPPADPVLAQLVSDGLRPVEPLQMHRCEGGGWGFQSLSHAGGFSLSPIRENPMDVRLFIAPGFDSAQLFGAVRFSEYASSAIGLGDDYIHGGAIMTAMDEVTSQCACYKCFSEATTTAMECRVKKKVHPHITYKLEAQVTRQISEFRVEVEGKLLDASGQTVMATAKAQMANVAGVPGMMEAIYGGAE